VRRAVTTELMSRVQWRRQVACVCRFGRVHVTLTSRISGIHKGGARGLNTSTSEIASGASVWPSLRLHVVGASEEGAILVSYLRYRCLEHELRKALELRPGCGRLEEDKGREGLR
jgi:hypothetical protein